MGAGTGPHKPVRYLHFPFRSYRSSRGKWHIVRANDQSLGAALDGIAGIGNADILRLRYSASVNERESLRQRIAGLFKELLPNVEFTNGASKLTISGKRSPQSKVETFDLLKNVMTSKQEFIRLNTSRALDTESAYQTIIAAHNAILPDIEQAITVMGP